MSTGSSRRGLDDKYVAWLFLLPGFIILTLTFLYPLLYSAYMSLSRWNLLVPGSKIEFIGLLNYQKILTDAGFWASAARSFTFTAVSLPIQLVLGTLIAVLLTNEMTSNRVTSGMRVLLLIPLMMPPVVVGILWRLMLNVQYGPLNSMLSGIGIQPMMWIASPETSLGTVIMVEVLANTSVVAMILIGGMLSLPREPILAAQIDGASSLRILLEIKLPQLASYYLIIMLIRIMDLLKTFDFIYAMTFGGPGTSTEVLNLYIYRLATRFLEYTKAAAASWVFLAILLLPSIFLLMKAVSHSNKYIND